MSAAPEERAEQEAQRTQALEAALIRAAEEQRLQPWYRDCVRPLLNMPRSQWPRCCGRGCEPCMQTLVAVAERVQALLQRDPA